MAIELYSSSYKTVDIKLYGDNIIGAFNELRRIQGIGEVKAYRWSDNCIAASITDQVDKPSRGTVGGIDIRDEEPILIVFHKNQYPYCVPMVFFDRKDFPVTRLPHINPTLPGVPFSMCLHRGNTNDWFSEHSLSDFYKRIRGWLRDAAMNRLIPPGDFFEATRIENDFGVAIYDPIKLFNTIEEYWSKNSGQAGHLFLLMKLIGDSPEFFETQKSGYSVELVQVLPQNSDYQDFQSVCRRLNAMAEELKRKDKLLVGIFVFPGKNDEYTNYIALKSQKLMDFISMCKDAKLHIESALNEYIQNGLQLLKGIPLIAAIQRPSPIIGTESKIELLHFLASAYGKYEIEGLNWPGDMPVHILSNRKPLTVELARDISSSSELVTDENVTILGCGAIGSKISLHFARAGVTNLLLVDNDSLSPHNLVRHALFANSVGKNKAEAIKEAIEDIYRGDKENISIESQKISIFDIAYSEIVKSKVLIDCTASSAVQSLLVGNKLDGPRIIRCEIADNGRLGFVSFEGQGRNPRLDDLQSTLFDSAIDNEILSRWLQNYRVQRESRTGPVLEEINIGLSCSSATMRLSDDIISYHSSAFSFGIRNSFNDSLKQGKVQISFLDNDPRFPSFVAPIEVGEVLISNSRGANQDWQIRISNNACLFIRQQLLGALPLETGGILIGYLQPKRKILYVTRALPAPADSQSSPYAFKRGITDVPDIVSEIEKRTGNLLGYIGEWHTHPFGGGRPSGIDMNAVRGNKSVLDKVNRRTYLLIATPRGFFSYLY